MNTTTQEQDMDTRYYQTAADAPSFICLLQELESIGFNYLDFGVNPWTDEDWDRDYDRIEEIIAIAESHGCIRKISCAYGVDMFVYPAYDEDGNKVMLDPTDSIELSYPIVSDRELLKLSQDADYKKNGEAA
jgi:hypothetical protein